VCLVHGFNAGAVVEEHAGDLAAALVHRQALLHPPTRPMNLTHLMDAGVIRLGAARGAPLALPRRPR
jgi:hypothetical protein